MVLGIVLQFNTLFAQDATDNKAESAPQGDASTANTPEKNASTSSAEPSTAEPATTEPTTSSEPTLSEGQTVQLRGLEQSVNELKERIFRSKARLNLLKETVLHGVIAGSRAVVRHKNEMGSSFKLVKLIYVLDGKQVYSKSDDSGALDEKKEFDVFNGAILPGNHTLSVQMVFRGHGYGIFSYLKGYRFTVRASHAFTAGEGRHTLMTVRAFEKGNLTTELKDRPAVKFESSLVAASSGAAQQAEPQ